MRTKVTKFRFDVYLTNSRGNAYSFGHTTKKTSSKEYYDYSFQQMKYDIKANIQFVVGNSGREKVHYIAHSEGGTTMMAALADPDRGVAEYIEEHLDTFHAFAPVIYMVKSTFKLHYSTYFC